MSTLTSFPLFSNLPRELQTLVWRFAFLNNTSFASREYQEAISKATATEWDGEPVTALLYWWPPYELDDWYRDQAQIDTAFWTYHYDPYDETRFEQTNCWSDPGPWESPRICLEEHKNNDIRTLVMRFSGIPALLHACRESRIVTLKMWLEVMLGYYKNGFQPWCEMVVQVRKALKRMVRQRVIWKSLHGGGRTFYFTRRRKGQRD